MVGMGRIGKAIARRLDAFGVPVVYHSRRAQPDLGYRHYPDLVGMAREVDTLMVIVPGGAETRNLINAEVLRALGPNGILINIARGSVVDEPALIKALQDRTIYAAGPTYSPTNRPCPTSSSRWSTSSCYRMSPPPRSTRAS